MSYPIGKLTQRDWHQSIPLLSFPKPAHEILRMIGQRTGSIICKIEGILLREIRQTGTCPGLRNRNSIHSCQFQMTQHIHRRIERQHIMLFLCMNNFKMRSQKSLHFFSCTICQPFSRYFFYLFAIIFSEGAEYEPPFRIQMSRKRGERFGRTCQPLKSGSRNYQMKSLRQLDSLDISR